MSEPDDNNQPAGEYDDLAGEQYKRPDDCGDPYDITSKDGKDPWKPNLAKQIFSWCFWLFMLYVCTAGFIYGYLTQDENADTGMADAIFMPAEMVRNYSYTYQQISDWQINFFREVEELADPDML